MNTSLQGVKLPILYYEINFKNCFFFEINIILETENMDYFVETS